MPVRLGALGATLGLAGAEADRRRAQAVERGATYTVIAWQMGVVAKVLRMLPNWFYDRLFRRNPRKVHGLLG